MLPLRLRTHAKLEKHPDAARPTEAPGKRHCGNLKAREVKEQGLVEGALSTILPPMDRDRRSPAFVLLVVYTVHVEVSYAPGS